MPELTCTRCHKEGRATPATWYAWPDAENAQLWVFEPYTYLCNACLAAELLDNPDKWRYLKIIKTHVAQRDERLSAKQV